MCRCFMVRAGERGHLFTQFVEKQVVALGWNEIRSAETLTDLGRLKAAMLQAYPGDKPSRIGMSAGQLYRFYTDIAVGDVVMTYDPVQREYMCGTVTSAPYLTSDSVLEYIHCRSVHWQTAIPRDSLSTKSKNSLGSIGTLFELIDDVRAEVFGKLGLAAADGNSAGAGAAPPERPESEAGEALHDIMEDFEGKAHEFIKDRLMALGWDQLQELVAALLRALGYKTRVSKPGGDRGKDIVASADGLGIAGPRVIVEVKHRGHPIGAPDIRSFLPVCAWGDSGIYVSTGGFTKEAHYEAERADARVTLVDADYLTDLIVENYDSFDNDGKALIPLRKVYWPA